MSDVSVRGKIGEDAVCAYLERNGCEIIRRNYRKRHGEIDIIALDGDEIAFVEVKTRKFGSYSEASDALTKTKMKRIIETSEIFISENERYEDNYRRFDAAYVTVTTEKFPRVLGIEYYRADFNATSIE